MTLEFEWDEKTRLSNIEKHGIDFLRARQLFVGRPTMTRPSAYEHELRYKTTGLLNGDVITAIWTSRLDVVRFISVRRARHEETRNYRNLYGG